MEGKILSVSRESFSPMSGSIAPPCRGGDQSCPEDHVKLGVVTISDRASAGIYDDLSGPAILQFFNEAIHSRRADYFFERRGSLRASISLSFLD